MLCVPCGAQMHLVEVRGDDTMMVRGYEHHTFECRSCGEIERRLTFSSAKRAPTGRIVQICHDPDEATYAAKDTKLGMVVMRNRDHQRLRELCEWIGWGVMDGKVPSSKSDAK
jgi:hypothetical protein